MKMNSVSDITGNASLILFFATDEDTLFRHNATWFRVQESLLFPGNTLFCHENICFRGGVKSFRTGSTCLRDGYTG